MKVIIIKFGILILNIIYSFIKLFPLKRRILFLSRQSNKESIDILLLKKELKKKDKSIEIVVLCKKLESGIKNKILYFFHMFVQMYYLATSKVIILDGYSIAACTLKKKKGTTIIQMWHALGAFKKFGYSVLGKEEGSNKKLALTMKMHNNYDYVLTSSEETIKYFSEAFNTSKNNVIVMPLPRVDLLTSKEYKEKIKSRIIKQYPIIKKKKNILYVPTFRKDGENIDFINNLIDFVDFNKYNLIIKLHPLSKIEIKDKRIILSDKFSSVDMMMISNYVITDYSAIVFEASLLNKPIFFYPYDYEKYYKKRDFYIDYKKEMPGVIAYDAGSIINSIENNDYDLNEVKEFCKKYISFTKNKCTVNLVEFILKYM